MTRTPPRGHAARAVVPLLVAVVQAVVVLGPALGRGVAITHDMPWSPDPRWTAFVLGIDTPAPRAVPSDAVAVLLGTVLGASLAQHLVLLGLLIGLGLGASALVVEVLPRAGTAARCAAVVAAVWNPFVSERLLVGQWVVILGLAVLPWTLRAALRCVRGERAGHEVLTTLVLGGLGGANSLVLVGGAAVMVLAVGALSERSWGLARVAALAALVTAGVGAAWILPSLASSPTSDVAGVHAFGPVADSPVGVIGSLLGGGGFWNVATHPEPRDQLLIGVASAAVCAVAVLALMSSTRGAARRCLAGVILVFGAIVLWSAIPAASTSWAALVAGLPGGGLLRDSHKFVGPWVICAATGLGVLVQQCLRRIPTGLTGPVVGLLIGLPIVLSPQLVWGIGGRLDATVVPASYRTDIRAVNELPAGDVGLLPWSQYRRYDWNDSRVSLTLAPRMIDEVVLYDDSLPLRSGRIGGESVRAAGVSVAIESGTAPAEALKDAGVRYVAAELGTTQDVDVPALRAMGPAVVDSPQWLVVEVATPAASGSTTGAVIVTGWVVTLLTAMAVGVGTAIAARRRRALLASVP
ncbi:MULTISPECIES: hypothetical protein [unclassified Janibacter]|uniref:hypothetical protein n=1 Tax=unclassified Janibacter TaxID=2649294 RepID=UPI003D052FE8